MQSLEPVVALLERQCHVFTQLEGVLQEQQTALLARDLKTIEAANRQASDLAGLLAAIEERRQQLMDPRVRLSDLAGLACETPLSGRVEALIAALPALAHRVSNLARTNRVLANDARLSCQHLLRLLGIEEEPGYSPHPGPIQRPGVPLRLDIRA